MNTAALRHSDFSLDRCRAELANFDQATVEQAVVVMTSQNAAWLENAANHPEFGRAIFWVREWSMLERVKTRQEAMKRLKVIRALRSERQAKMRQAAMGIFIAVGSLALTAHAMVPFAG